MDTIEVRSVYSVSSKNARLTWLAGPVAPTRARMLSFARAIEAWRGMRSQALAGCVRQRPLAYGQGGSTASGARKFTGFWRGGPPVFRVSDVPAPGPLEMQARRVHRD